ncbi:MAG TPA: hypothetical protein VG013_13305 [Gemmataceae bacterium]|nr:hypothetical protein [Gemmataceae bacterium]
MSLETDFLVASQPELEAAFPGWVPPRPRVSKDKTWAPSRPFPILGKSHRAVFKAEMAALQKLPHAQFRRVDPVKLGTLQAIVCGGEQLVGVEDRPALLVNPKEADEWLLRLTDTLVHGLARLTRPQLKAAAKRWLETEELQADRWSARDAASLIEALSELAKRASDEKKNLYVWMRL